MKIRQSTVKIIMIGPFLDSTDGDTPITGLTIANTSILIRKEGGITFTNPTSGATEISGGFYYFTATTTNTNTLGDFEVNCHVATALPVQKRCIVITANAYDSLVLGTDRLDVDVTTNNDKTGYTATASNMRGTDGANTIAPNVVIPDPAGTAATLHGITDGKVDTVDTVVDSIKVDTGTDIPALISAVPTAVFSFVVESGKTFAEFMKGIFAVLINKSTGGGTGSVSFRDIADTKNRATSSIDVNQNRTTSTTDLT